MDTETVLKIIAMLDTRIEHYNQKLLICMDDDAFGAKWALMVFRDNLQEFIETQVNYAENTLGE